MEIKKIQFKSGFLANKQEAKNLSSHIWDWEELPKKLKELLAKDKPWALSGRYGHPSAAEPIQYHHISFIGKDKTEAIEFFNLAAVYFQTGETEELRRIFRCLVRFDDIKGV